MSDPTDPGPAFPTLQRALWRRRLRGVDPMLRLELAALTAMVSGFIFWQARVMLAARAHAGGAPRVAAALAMALGLLALAGAIAVGARHASRLARGPAGPEWLALPLEPRQLASHLAWEARPPGWLVVPPALAVLVAAWGLAPAWMLALLATAFAGALAAGGRVAAGLAFRAVATAAGPRPGLDPLTRVLTRAARAHAGAGRPAARWRRGPVWLALLRKDLAVTSTPSAARSRLVPPLAFGIASVAVWWSPLGPPEAQRALAFALALLAAGALAEWSITLAGSDPFSALRVLPLGARSLWAARFASALAFIIALLAAHAAFARVLPPAALQVFVTWIGAAACAIAALGVNYGVTLFPRADLARRLLSLSLGLAIAASLMIPLAGWVLLLAAVFHSARRLPRWSRIEEVA